MLQTEIIEAFGRFQAAAGIETDRAYDLSPGMILPTSGTAIVAGQTELENANMYYWASLARAYEDQFDVSALVTFVNIGSGDGPKKTADSLIVSDLISGLAGDTVLDVDKGEAAELTNDIQAVVDYTRSHGLQEIADRLIELGLQPLGDDEAPLQAESATCFVKYCITRQKQARPMMTVTPVGELDATWKGSEGERIMMRFFPSGSVWVAYKLLKERGSFETAATDLLDANLHFKFPHWA